MVPCNARGRNRPRHRLASLRRRIVNNMSTALMRSHRDRMTPIGKAKQEGITSEGSYTWSNLWLLIDCALIGGVQGDSTGGATLLDAT